MQNIFIIEAVSTGRFYAKEIAWRGYHPVVIYPYLENITDVYKQYRVGGSDYARKFTDDIIFMDSDSSEAYQALLDKFQPVAVVAGSELGVIAADYLARKAGLPGNDPATAECRRNKFAMVEALQKAGVPAIRSAKLNSVDECLQLAAEWNTWPVVIKPLSGAGTKGVHFCSSMDELRAKAEEVFKDSDLFGYGNAQILMQEFAKGTEFIVNTVSCGGRHAITDVWRYRKIAVGDKGNAYDYAKLVTQPDADERAVMDYALQVLDALGFEYGPSHTEIMLTERGPLLIETGARPMGAVHDTEALQEALGHFIIDVSLDTYIDPAAAEAFAAKPYSPAKTIMTKVFISQECAELKEIPLFTLLKYLPTVRKGDFDYVKSTMRVEVTVDLATTPGELQLCGSEEQVMHDYTVLRAFEQQAFDLIFAKKVHYFTVPQVTVSLADGGEWLELALSKRSDGTIRWTDLIDDLGSFAGSTDVQVKFTGVVPELALGLELLMQALYFENSGGVWKKVKI